MSIRRENPQPSIASKVNRIDWANWLPVDRGTLLFIVRHGKVLLIHKKRGLGAGNLNGPGGRLEAGESPIQCAIREVQEELLIEAIDPQQIGELQFQFLDGYSIHVWVFLARDFSGNPTETEEAIPIWTPLNEIPYERMWEDDRYWLPLLLERRPFLGRFIFDEDRMLDYQLHENNTVGGRVSGSASNDAHKRGRR